MRKIFAAILLCGILLLPGTETAAAPKEKTKKTYHDPRSFARARVEKIVKVRDERHDGVDEIRVHLKILDGTHKGETRISVYRGEDDMPSDMFYRQGDVVFIGISTVADADTVEYISLYDIDNTAGIVVMLVLFVVTIIFIGRLRGVLAIVSLAATMFFLFYILIPVTLNGYSPLPVAVGISFFSIIVTIPIILGLKRKTLAAIAGAASGVVLATLLSLCSGWIMHLSGIVTNEMLTVFYASGVHIDIRGLALSGIVIAALGAIMDVCISIASATEELFKVSPDLSVKDAFKSVLTVSSDMLGATVNTLLFAYVGSSLPMVLLIAMRLEPGVPFWLIMNYNPVLSELIKSLIGCIGMFLSMPATALLCIELHKRAAKRAAKKNGVPQNHVL